MSNMVLDENGGLIRTVSCLQYSILYDSQEVGKIKLEC